MPGFLPKLRIVGKIRKCRAYTRFHLRIGGDIILKHLRYYPETDGIWMPKRKGFRQRPIVDIEISKTLRAAITEFCRERWGRVPGA
jgi:hypothetical protein